MIGNLPLALTATQAEQLEELCRAGRKSKRASGGEWIQRNRSPHPKAALELDTGVVRLTPDSVELLVGSPLQFVSGNRLKGFNPAIDRAFLICGPDGWSVEVWFKARPRKEKPKKRDRMHNDAAIFVTKEVGNRLLSGGLPSLGKRR